MIGLVLFLLALFILNRALGENSYRDIFRDVLEFPSTRIAGAMALTAVSYLILTCYDHLALQYLQKRIGKVRVSLASFISYCFSRNLGFALLTGGSIRYRFYSAWGLSAEEIARLITFAAMTFLLGFLTIGGSILLVSPASLPATPLTFWAVRPLGLFALFLVGVYLLLVFLRQQPFRFRTWQVKLPCPVPHTVIRRFSRLGHKSECSILPALRNNSSFSLRFSRNLPRRADSRIDQPCPRRPRSFRVGRRSSAAGT